MCECVRKLMLPRAPFDTIHVMVLVVSISCGLLISSFRMREHTDLPCIVLNPLCISAGA